MTADYVAGTTALVLTAVPWLVAAPRLARRLAPDWHDGTFALGSAVLGISGILLVAELTGIFGGFSRWTVATVSLVVATIVARLGRPLRLTRPRPTLPTDLAAWVALAAVAVCLAAVSATFLARDARALQTGPDDSDSLHYHLPTAARFVQTHSIDHVQQTETSDPGAYYPYDAELLQAVAMLGPRPDIAVFGLNLLFGWLALLACWVIGARWSRGATAVASGSVILSTPLLAGFGSGPGLNDVPTVAMFMSGIALLVAAGVSRGDQPRSRWGAQIAIAGLALGLAAGSKLSTLTPAALVAIGALLLMKRDRRLFAGVVAGTAFLTGGFWYVRDWVAVGSPVPGLNLAIGGHGFHRVPYPRVAPEAFSVAHYLNSWSVIRHSYVPGLHNAWSIAWPVIGLMLVAGVVLALVRPAYPMQRVLAVVVIVGFIAYIVTPTTAYGLPGKPVLFAVNTRYALPIMMLAFVLFATSKIVARFEPAVTVVLMVVVVVCLTDRHYDANYFATLRGALALLVLLVALALAAAVWLRSGTRATTVTVVVLAVSGLAAGAEVQHKYLHNRYLSNSGADYIYDQVGSMSGQRVIVAGQWYQYPFYGPTFANTVDFLGSYRSDHAYIDPTDCVQARRDIASDHATIFVLEFIPPHTHLMDELRNWVGSLPGTSVVTSNSAGIIYRLPAQVTDAGC